MKLKWRQRERKAQRARLTEDQNSYIGSDSGSQWAAIPRTVPLGGLIGAILY